MSEAQYPGALWIPHNKWGYPQNQPGRNGQQLKYIINHGTASAGTAQQQANNFAMSTRPAGTHFIIGQDGTVVQCVLIEDAAWGNGGPVGQADAFWPRNINSNLLTVSIEHCKPHSDNSDLLTPAQQLASFKLQDWLCKTYNIPPHWADETGGITGHYSIDPVNRKNCPGPFPWNQLFAALAAPAVNYKTQQAADVWHSTSYPDGTGIYAAWFTAYQHSIICGPPIGAEFATVDWAGNPIQCQYFASGVRIEYYVKAAPGFPAGSHHGYTAQGQLW